MPSYGTFIPLICLVFIMAVRTLPAGWARSELPEGSGFNDITAIQFHDNSLGWAMSAGAFNWRLVRTQDGGQSWELLSEGSESSDRGVAGFRFFSETNGWLWVGGIFGGPLLRTTDGGATWERVDTPLKSSSRDEVHAAYFIDDQTGWIVGRGNDDENQLHMLARTTNGGASWEFVPTPVYFNGRHLAFDGSGLGVVVGEAALFTADGGATWEAPILGAADTFSSAYIDSISGQGWIGGGNGLLLMTRDQGRIWQEGSPQRYGSIDAIHRSSTGRFLIAGAEDAVGFLHEGTVENLVWARHHLPQTTPQVSIPMRIHTIAERPDGALFIGGAGIAYLLPDSEPVLRAIGDRDPFNVLPRAIAGQPWAFQFQVIGGVAPFTWEASGLPEGFSIDEATGRVSGTPTATASFQFTVTVTDSRGRGDTMSRIQVGVTEAPLRFASTFLLPATHRKTYRDALDLGGGNPPYYWRIVEGALPRGMTIEGEGILAGVPQEVGVFSFTAEVTDSSGMPQRARAELALEVEPLAEGGWEVQHAMNRIMDLHFFDEVEGVAGGWSGVLYRTKNGGRTWDLESLHSVIGISEITSLDFAGDVGILTSGTGVFHSTDRGQTWTRVLHPGDEPVGTISPLVRVAAPDLAFLINNRITRSTDGGLTWHAVEGELPSEEARINDLSMSPEGIGWATAPGLYLGRSTDGGATWSRVEVPGIHGTVDEALNLLFGVAAVGNRVWLGTSIAEQNQGMKVFRSLDGGDNWTEHSLLPSSGYMYYVHFLPDGLHGWTSGIERGRIMRTTDGGDTWSHASTWDGDAHPMNVQFLDENVGWLVINSIGPSQGNVVGNMQGSIWRTENGGQDWTIQLGYPMLDGATTLSEVGFTRQHTAPDITSLRFASLERGFAIAQDPAFRALNPARLMRTDNGGASWHVVRHLERGARIAFASERVGYIFTPRTGLGYGIGYETRDGGENWLRTTNARGDDFFFVDEMHGWRSLSGNILRTVDSGRTWETVSTQDPGSIGSPNRWLLSFTDRQHGWRVPHDAFIANVIFPVQRTADGGETWTAVDSNPSSPNQVNRATFIHALDNNTAWIGGNGGGIFQTSDGGATWELFQYDGEAMPVWTGLDFVSCSQGFAVGYFPRESVPTVGIPVIAPTSSGNFSEFALQTFGISNHSILDLSSIGGENIWAYGALGAGVKYAAPTEAIAIATEALPLGTEGLPYEFQLQVDNAAGEVTWSLCAGWLPPGLELNSDGSITGTPEEAGGFLITATVNGADGTSTGRELSLVINPTLSPQILTETLPPGTIFTDYGALLEAGGSEGPYSWSLAGGQLPPGLRVIPHGAISGIPLIPGTYEFEVEARDSQLPPGTTRRALTLAVAGETHTPSRIGDIVALLLGIRRDPTGLDVNGNSIVDSADIVTEALAAE